MTNLRTEKRLDALPVVLVPNTLYFVKTGHVVRIYVTDSTGSEAIPLNGNEPEIEPFLLLGVKSG